LKQGNKISIQELHTMIVTSSLLTKKVEVLQLCTAN